MGGRRPVVAQSGVDAGGESSVVGEALQEGDEVVAVGLVDPGEQLCFLLVGGALGAGKQVVSGGGEVQGVGAPVGGVAAAFDESAVFQIIDQTHHHVAVDAHGVGELLLRLSLVLRQVHEQSEVTRPHT
jgi:hypothetical protein